jgi:polysaccharide biosynthesis protein PslH
MRAVFLTCHLPYPPISGGRLREYELLRRIAQEVDVHVYAISKTYEEDLLAAHELRRLCSDVTVVPAAGNGIQNGHEPAQISSHASPAAAAHVRDLVANSRVDLVHVEGFYLAQHVPALCPVPLLLVEQNVEYELWRQRMETAADEHERRAFFLQYRLTRDREIRAWRRATLCATVTDDDRALVHRAAPEVAVRVIPDGADHLGGSAEHEPEDDTVVLVANFAYEPNADSAEWLCREILPLVAQRVPNVRVLLVGNEPPCEVRALADRRVTVTGRVPRIEPYLDRAAVVVCPLRIGGGIKVKILEALRRGKPIVTTSVGVQGLGPGGRRAVRVADEAGAFGDAVADLLERPRERRALARAAHAFAARLPTWDDSAAALLSSYRDLVEAGYATTAAASALTSSDREPTPSLR